MTWTNAACSAVVPVVSAAQPGEGPALSEFGAALSAMRIRARMTQQELADRAGVSVRALRNIERGKVRPRPETERRLTEAVRYREERPRAR